MDTYGKLEMQTHLEVVMDVVAVVVTQASNAVAVAATAVMHC